MPFQVPNWRVVSSACATRIVGALVAMWLLVAQSLGQSANDPGLGWHLATGQFILSHGEVPRLDPFTFAPSPKPWIADQWLGDLLLYVTYSLGSFPLLCSALVALFLATYWGMLFSFIHRHEDSPLVTLFTVMVAMKLAVIHFIIRPVPLSFTLFALALAACITIYRARLFNSPPPRAQLAIFIALVGGFIVWTSTHPSFVMGLLVLGATAVFHPLEAGSKLYNFRAFLTSPLLIVFGLSCVATLINPYGIHIYDALLSQSQWTDITSEWRPIDLSQPEGTLLGLSLVMITVAYARYPSVRARITRLEFLLVIIFAAASLRAVRMAPYFGIVAALPLTISISEIVRRALRRSEQTSIPRPSTHARSGARVIFALAAALLAYTYTTNSVPLFNEKSARYSPSLESFPIDALGHLASIASKESPQGVLALPDWGGAITWFGAGHLRPAIDDRDTLFSLKDYQDNITLLRRGTPEAIYAVMEQTRLKYVVVEAHSLTAERLANSSRFEPVYRDGTAAAFSVKTTP